MFIKLNLNLKNPNPPNIKRQKKLSLLFFYRKCLHGQYWNNLKGKSVILRSCGTNTLTKPIFISASVPRQSSSENGCGHQKLFACFWVGLPSTKLFSGGKKKAQLFFTSFWQTTLNSCENVFCFMTCMIYKFLLIAFSVVMLYVPSFSQGVKPSSTEL